MDHQEFKGDWVDYERIYRRYRYRCVYCGFDCSADLDSYHQLEVDHVIPVSEDGDAAWHEDNMVASCAVCNRIKSSFVPEGKKLEERLDHARRYIMMKRRVAEEYYRARAKVWRSRWQSGEERVGEDQLLSLRDELLRALRMTLPEEKYECSPYDRAKKVRWIEVWNEEDKFDWYVGIDEDRGLSLQNDTANQAWSKVGPVEGLVTSLLDSDADSIGKEMRALIWAGFDPKNAWARIGPPVFSISEATLWVVGALGEGEALMREMKSIQDYLQRDR